MTPYEVVTGRRQTTRSTLTRHAHAFFQGNRFLLGSGRGRRRRRAHGRVLDLYAGVGLFSVALAAAAIRVVAASKATDLGADDLKRQRDALGGAIEARHQAVETFLAVADRHELDTVIVDPPRTG